MPIGCISITTKKYSKNSRKNLELHRKTMFKLQIIIFYLMMNNSIIWLISIHSLTTIDNEMASWEVKHNLFIYLFVYLFLSIATSHKCSPYKKDYNINTCKRTHKRTSTTAYILETISINKVICHLLRKLFLLWSKSIYISTDIVIIAAHIDNWWMKWWSVLYVDKRKVNWYSI